MSVWTHRVCETCWTGKYGVIDGIIQTAPIQLKEPPLEPCCECGELCIITGIYIRRDPMEMLCRGSHDYPWEWSKIAERKFDAGPGADREEDGEPHR